MPNIRAWKSRASDAGLEPGSAQLCRRPKWSGEKGITGDCSGRFGDH